MDSKGAKRTVPIGSLKYFSSKEYCVATQKLGVKSTDSWLTIDELYAIISINYNEGEMDKMVNFNPIQSRALLSIA